MEHAWSFRAGLVGVAVPVALMLTVACSGDSGGVAPGAGAGPAVGGAYPTGGGGPLGGTYPLGGGGPIGGGTGTCAPGRGLSEICCAEYGLDACGAGLVCAALDGRTIPTCYAEGTRTGGQQCITDSLCVSQDCHETSFTCRPQSGEVCDPLVGCAQDPTTPTKPIVCTPGKVYSEQYYAYIPDRTKHTCVRVGSVVGPCGACATNDDCHYETPVCSTGICTDIYGLCEL